MFRASCRNSPTLAFGALALACGFMAIAPGWAAAQEAIPTAKDSAFGGAPPLAPPGPLSLPTHRSLGAENLVRAPVGPCGGLPDPQTGKLDKSPHGEVFAGVGSAGYREAGGEVCVPLSDHVAAHLAVDVGRFPYYGGRPY
jgi:hypothetical protein